MKMRVVLLIVLAFGAAMGTVYFAHNWMEAQRAAMSQAPAPEPAHNEILVAKEDLPAGTLIKPEQLRWQAWPDASMAATYVPKDGKRAPEDFAGAVVREGLSTGQPITDSIVVKPGESGFLAAVLAPGMRAVSVSINATTGISGFIFPGDRVDVILTQNIKHEGEEQKDIVHRASETVLSNVRVIAVDQTTNDQEEKPVVAKNVTLEVTPKQAEVVTLASEIGKLSFSLRSMVRDESGPSVPEQIAQREDVADKSDADKKPEQKDGKPAPAPGRHTFTWDSEASVLLGRGRPVNVLHGEKAETQDLRSTK
jgi:pilus assembly protein CpaB